MQPIEKNLFKGIFLRRPGKPVTYEVKQPAVSDVDNSSSFNSSFASDFTNNINNRTNLSNRVKSVRERSYEITEDHDASPQQPEEEAPYFPTIQRDDMSVASKVIVKKLKDMSE